MRHIGITGHQNSWVLMDAIRRDTAGVLDTLLVGMNANDRRAACHQNNVLPLAVARGLGLIAMKLFAHGAFFGGPARFGSRAEDWVLTVGSPGAVPHTDLFSYPLSIPGVAVAIIGVGHIDRDNPDADQMAANLSAALAADVLPSTEMRRIESDVAAAYPPEINFFNERRAGIVQPTGVAVERDADRVTVSWNTALAGADPLRSYDIYAGDRLVLSTPFRPQMTAAPLSVSFAASDINAEPVRVPAR